jgi:hypothetical protein
VDADWAALPFGGWGWSRLSHGHTTRIQEWKRLIPRTNVDEHSETGRALLLALCAGFTRLCPETTDFLGLLHSAAYHTAWWVIAFAIAWVLFECGVRKQWLRLSLMASLALPAVRRCCSVHNANGNSDDMSLPSIEPNL